MNNNLYNALVEWRKNVVRESKGERMTFIKNESLELIATYHPSSMENLRRIKGIGPKTLENFGNEIIQVVNSFPGKDTTPSSVEMRMENIDLLIRSYRDMGTPNRDIAYALVCWCEESARDEGVDALHILSDKQVVMLSAMHPNTEKALMGIYEMGRLAIYKWGDKIIRIINSFPGEETLPPQKSELSLEEILASYSSFGLKPDMVLVKELCELREGLSRKHGNRPYPFLTPTQIANISAMHPLTLESLKKVLRCSDSYVAIFGESVCNCVAKYYSQESIPKTLLDYDFRKPSYLESLRLFQEGFTIEQICIERCLAKSTVEDHLVNAYKKDHIDIDKLIDPVLCHEIASLILPLIQSRPTITLTEIYEELGGAYPFHELKLARESLEKKSATR